MATGFTNVLYFCIVITFIIRYRERERERERKRDREREKELQKITKVYNTDFCKTLQRNSYV